MNRFEIVDPRSNGEAVFLVFRQKWLLDHKIAKMARSRTKQAVSQCMYESAANVKSSPYETFFTVQTMERNPHP